MMVQIPFKMPLAALALALALGAGCTSDDPNRVGDGLTDIGLDSALVAVTLGVPSSYGALDVTNGARPLDEQEVLYLGADDGDASSILVTFDFSTLPDDLWTEDLLQLDNIETVQLRLQMLTWYFRNHGATSPDSLPSRFWPGVRKMYKVYRLAAPVDTLSYPGPEPTFGFPVDVEPDELYASNGPVYITLDREVAAGWIAEQQRVSLLIRESDASEPGLQGFASKEMTHGGSTLPESYAADSVGPTLVVNTTLVPDTEIPDPNLVIKPVADVSTWHALEDPPAIADGILFRTHLRSYPALGFDLAALPPNVRVNRAELTLVTDTTRVSGPSHVMVASEILPEFAPPGVTSVVLADLEPAIFVVNGRSGLNPEDDASDIIAIDVTSSVQRFLNHAYDGERAFLLTEGESFMTGWRTNPSPDFWFRRRVFYGTADPDSSHRPRLKVVYSRQDELSEEQP